jgi:hypothetical protein
MQHRTGAVDLSRHQLCLEAPNRRLQTVDATLACAVRAGIDGSTAGLLQRDPDDVDFVNLLMHRCFAHCKPLQCFGRPAIARPVANAHQTNL